MEASSNIHMSNFEMLGIPLAQNTTNAFYVQKHICICVSFAKS